MTTTTIYTWRWRKRLGERYNQRCRVLARGAKNSVLVEFEDGYRVVTSRWAVRQVLGSAAGKGIIVCIVGMGHAISSLHQKGAEACSLSQLTNKLW